MTSFCSINAIIRNIKTQQRCILLQGLRQINQAFTLNIAAGYIQVVQYAVLASQDWTDPFVDDVVWDFNLVAVDAIFFRNVDINDGLTMV